MWPNLIPSPSLTVAPAALRKVALDARNISQRGPGTIEDYRGWYLSWLRVARSSLGQVAGEAQASALVKSDAHWHIRGLREGDHRAIEVILDELDLRAGWFDGFADHICSVLSRIDRGTGTVAVLDTHLLLHFAPPPNVPWTSLLTADAVRLVLPLRVVEELDKKKWEGSAKVGARASSALSWLRRCGDVAVSPAEIRAAVTIEVHVPEEPRARPGDADQEILDTAVLFAGLQPEVVLVTGDAAFEMRARAAGLAVRMLDEAKYARVRPPTDPEFEKL